MAGNDLPGFAADEDANGSFASYRRLILARIAELFQQDRNLDNELRSLREYCHNESRDLRKEVAAEAATLGRECRARDEARKAEIVLINQKMAFWRGIIIAAQAIWPVLWLVAMELMNRRKGTE